MLIKKISKNLAPFLLVVFLFFPVFAVLLKASKAQTTLNASLEYQGNQRILNLWGTNYEMGYGEGYLLAEEITNLIEFYLFQHRSKSNLAIYNSWLEEVNSKFYFPPQYEEQLQGLLAGMQASGKNIFIPSLGREVNLADLKLWNAYLDFTGGCSSFAVWNTASSTGETIHARNFNYKGDSQGYFDSYTLLRTVDLTDSNLADWVSPSWPGFIGAISGLNQHGVTISTNYGADGQRNPENTQNVPVGLILRSSLEQADLVETVADIENIIRNNQKRLGLITHLSFPSQPTLEEASVVFESDGNGTVVRYSDFDFPQYDHIIAKNHFLAYDTGIADPSTSVATYQKIADLLQAKYQSGDGKVDLNEARAIIREVAGKPNHNIIVLPNSMKFELSIRQPDLTLGIPQTYNWNELFPNHDTPTPNPQMYVAKIEMQISTKVSQSRAKAKITIKDTNDLPVGDVVVSTHWSGLTNDLDLGTTNSNGQVIFVSDPVPSTSSGLFTVTVDNASKDNWTYNPSLNLETSDSIGL